MEANDNIDSVKPKQKSRDFNDYSKNFSAKICSKEIFSIIVKHRRSLDNAQETEKNNSHLFPSKVNSEKKITG